MTTPSDDGLTQYAYNTHLRQLETQVFNTLSGRSCDPYQRMAREDVRRALRRYGYIDPLVESWGGRLTGVRETRRGEIANRSSKARATLVVSNPTMAPVTIPLGATFGDMDPYGDDDTQLVLDSAQGAYRWAALAELVVAPESSAELLVEATVAGAPHNLCQGAEVNGELGTMYAVPSSSAWAVGITVEWGALDLMGVDHQLARLTCYRALVYAFSDLSLSMDDPSDFKRKLYEKRYKDELELMISSGVEITVDGNGDVTSDEDALRYGNMTLTRS